MSASSLWDATTGRARTLEGKPSSGRAHPSLSLQLSKAQTTQKIFFTKNVKKGLQTLLNAFTIQNARFDVILLFIESGYY